MKPPFDERALFAACVAGDAEARRDLGRRYHRAMRQVIGFCPAARQGKVGTADIEDAVQQAFLTFLAHDARVLRDWQGTASARTYLARVATRVATRHFRQLVTRKARFQLSLDADDTPEAALAGDTPEVSVVLAEGAAITSARDAILERLSPKGRQFYHYLFVRELSVAAIARAEDIKPNSVYQWKNRIGQVAAEVLIEHGYGPSRSESKKNGPDL